MPKARRAALLAILGGGARCAPVEPAHTCAFVSLTRTNLPPTAAAEVVRIFAEEAEEKGSDAPAPLAKRLGAELGGFWDILFFGSPDL